MNVALRFVTWPMPDMNRQKNMPKRFGNLLKGNKMITSKTANLKIALIKKDAIDSIKRIMSAKYDDPSDMVRNIARVSSDAVDNMNAVDWKLFANS